LTSFIAAGIASPFRDRDRQFPVELDRLMAGFIGRDVACCPARRVDNKISINASYARRVDGLRAALQTRDRVQFRALGLKEF
jgi:hypothetical protein